MWGLCEYPALTSHPMLSASTDLQVSVILSVVADGAALILWFLLDLLAVILL